MCGSVIWDSELWKLSDHEFLRKIYTLCVCVCVHSTMCKIVHGKLLHNKRELSLVPCDNLQGWAEGVIGRLKREEMYADTQLIHGLPWWLRQ